MNYYQKIFQKHSYTKQVKHREWAKNVRSNEQNADRHAPNRIHPSISWSKGAVFRPPRHQSDMAGREWPNPVPITGPHGRARDLVLGLNFKSTACSAWCLLEEGVVGRTKARSQGLWPDRSRTMTTSRMLSALAALTVLLLCVSSFSQAADEHVTVLTESNFEQHVGGDKGALVEFYAPWWVSLESWCVGSGESVLIPFGSCVHSRPCCWFKVGCKYRVLFIF